MKKHLVLFFFNVVHLLVFAQLNTDRILTIGRNALYFEDYVLSIQYFNQVIKIKPFMAEPYMYRAMAKVQLGDDKGAELDATQALERNPFLPEAYYIRGFAKRRAGNYSQAVADFTSAINYSPSSQNLLLNRMDAYIRLEKYDEALVDLNTYMRLNKRNKQLLFEKGFIYLLKKDTVEAERNFELYLRNDSTNAQAWSAMGLIKLKRNEFASAYSYYSKAIALNSKNPGDYMNRGVINVQRKNFREALRDYDKAIALDKSVALAYYNRGLLRANLGDNNNALSDLEMVLTLDSTQIEALYRKAVIQNTLGMYQKSIADFTKIMNRHPFFLPAYYGLADAYEGLRNKTEAFRYRQLAYNLDKNKDEIALKQKNAIVANNKIDTELPKSSSSRRTELFNRFVIKNMEDKQSETKFNDSKRGNIQHIYTDVVNERNFTLSYYSKPVELIRTNLFFQFLEDYNKSVKLSAPLRITNNEVPLTAELVQMHFDAINHITQKIDEKPDDADLLFFRAMEFNMVQDFNSAIEDLNRAIILRSNFTIAYFMRAVIRYKLVEYNRIVTLDGETTSNELLSVKAKRSTLETKQMFETEIIIRDLDKVIDQQPSFPFAYFNKANILNTQKDFKSAISYYSKAIESDPDFAEAYFNRGLTHLFIGNDKAGIADLSKAGELGIYKSYNLIQRFNK